jgi:chromosome segregation ATPase
VSFSEQVEELQHMLTHNCLELSKKIAEYNELDKKFKLYYLQSDKYMKNQDQKLSELRKEYDDTIERHAEFDKNYNNLKIKAEDYENKYNELFARHEEKVAECKKYKLEVIRYE